MAILFDENTHGFFLHTVNTTYQMQVDTFGFLLHVFYGQRIDGQDMNYLIIPVDRGFSGNPYDAGTDRRYSLDTLPLEYPVEGVGDYRQPALSITGKNGSTSLDLRYKGHKIFHGKYNIPSLPALYESEEGMAETLEIILGDETLSLEVSLFYGVFAEKDIITRAVKVVNKSSEDVVMNRIFSASLDIQHGDGFWDFLHFHGRHNMERICERVRVCHGITLINSRRGISSHHHNPFLILCDETTTEDAGSCYGMNLVYSGNFSAGIEQDQTDAIRMFAGLNDENFSWNLTAGESFFAPEVVLTFSASGFSRLSQNYHDTYRHNLCRGKFKLCRRPIMINNWEATYFAFSSRTLVEIARSAVDLGIEMLVMDDGWFGKRNDDTSSLGDWKVNLEKIPGGLGLLVDELNSLGLKFGLWVEPEMVSEDSDLYRKHPDWALCIPNRNPIRSRHQLVLDMSRADVRDYIYTSLCSVLDSANIEYVKWDMNRSIADWFSCKLLSETQSELSHRYMLGVYDLLERLTSHYPDILFEGCAGGGGRFDPGMLYYQPLIWCSDNTDPIERLKIQYGTSFAYPVSSVSSHVSAVPNHQTGRCTSFATRCIVAMSGSFGFELDPRSLSAYDRETIRKQISEYKHFQHIIHDGLYYRLSNPLKDRYAAWMMAYADKSAALLNIVVMHVEANPRHVHVLLKGLDGESLYKVEGKTISGKALMNAGLSLSLPTQEYYSKQIYIERADENA
ncbi:alpha-galactosidase [Parasphaerochaeta coccoides]|uniref:Alpha-galactosidase n=1 Tax=Parasphaerochaeta coccoides (strain ATCC BAA-1237 / DSM 17374 / SPN1) TaxID=760011 RepID=F4GK93_PARC1|nr:alpha-galactosidase [Parasphaerochaeta coccoides]AEC02289.1 Alpha-galactosidase [Parasphaerochaeta coccoides DSM 17374]